jgi:hypothetical protein
MRSTAGAQARGRRTGSPPQQAPARRLDGLRDFQNCSRWPAVHRRHQQPAMEAVCRGIQAAGIGRRPTPRDQCCAAGEAGMADPRPAGGAGRCRRTRLDDAASYATCRGLRWASRLICSRTRAFWTPAGWSTYSFPVLVAVKARWPAYRPCQSSLAPTDNVPAYGASHRVWRAQCPGAGRSRLHHR